MAERGAARAGDWHRRGAGVLMARWLRRAGGEGGASDRHRGRQQPPGAPDRAAHRLKVRPDAISRAGVTEDPPQVGPHPAAATEPMPPRAGDTAARGECRNNPATCMKVPARLRRTSRSRISAALPIDPRESRAALCSQRRLLRDHGTTRQHCLMATSDSPAMACPRGRSAARLRRAV